MSSQGFDLTDCCILDFSFRAFGKGCICLCQPEKSEESLFDKLFVWQSNTQVCAIDIYIRLGLHPCCSVLEFVCSSRIVHAPGNTLHLVGRTTVEDQAEEFYFLRLTPPWNPTAARINP